MKFFLDTSICIDVLRTAGPESSVQLFHSLKNSHIGSPLFSLLSFLQEWISLKD